MPGTPAVFSPDGAAVITVREDRLTRWSLPQLQPAGDYEADDLSTYLMRVNLDPSGERLVLHGKRGLYVWDVASRRAVCNADGGARTMAFGRGAWACDDRTLRAVDVETRAASTRGPPKFVSCCAVAAANNSSPQVRGWA